MMQSDPNWTEVLQGLGSAVSAITSIALVLVALRFREEVRIARQRPTLSLSHNSKFDDTTFVDPHWNHDLCLSVENMPGQDRALGVGLELVSVTPTNGTPKLPMPPPRRSFVLAEMRGYEATETDLPPNIARRFVFLACKPAAISDRIAFEVKPRATESQRDLLPPGTYRAVLALTASNADATYWETEITFRGSPEEKGRVDDWLAITSPHLCKRPTH